CAAVSVGRCFLASLLAAHRALGPALGASPPPGLLWVGARSEGSPLPLLLQIGDERPEPRHVHLVHAPRLAPARAALGLLAFQHVLLPAAAALELAAGRLLQALGRGSLGLHLRHERLLV